MRTWFLALLVVLPVLDMALVQYATSRIQSFLRDTPTIESNDDLERFKAVVKLNMYGALALLPLALAPLVLFFGGIYADILAFGDWPWVAVPGILMAAHGYLCKQVEKRSYDVPVDHAGLRTERDRIVRVWQRKMLPDW